VASPAWALDNPDFTLTAGFGVETDSNLFRLPEGANLPALIGNTSGSDRISTTTLGASIHLHDSLQDLRANINAVDYRYQTFSDLDFTGINYGVEWGWGITPRLTGKLTADRKESPNSFDDGRGVNVRGQRLDTNTRLDAIYEVDGPWHLLAGASRLQQSSAQASDAYTANSAELGVRHVFATDSTLTYRAIMYDGSYLGRTLDATQLLDDRFREMQNDFRMHWMLSDVSSADANVTSISRTHPNFPQRDFNGWNSGAGLNWVLSGKTSLALSYAHTLGSYATTYSSYTQSDQWSIGPVWQISSKTQLAFRQSWTQVDYQGYAISALVPQRHDTSRDTSLSLNWTPSLAWTLSAMLQSLSRSSNLAGLDYQANVASISLFYSY
jgi:exopolysaccharide biosynthesis operon protein EpsL